MMQERSPSAHLHVWSSSLSLAEQQQLQQQQQPEPEQAVGCSVIGPSSLSRRQEHSSSVPLASLIVLAWSAPATVAAATAPPFPPTVLSVKEQLLDVLARAECGTTKTAPDPILDWVYAGDHDRVCAPLAAPPSPHRAAWFKWLCHFYTLFGCSRDGTYALVDEASGVRLKSCLYESIHHRTIFLFFRSKQRLPLPRN